MPSSFETRMSGVVVMKLAAGCHHHGVEASDSGGPSGARARRSRALRSSDAPGPPSPLAAARGSLVIARALRVLGACRARQSRARHTSRDRAAFTLLEVMVT